MYTCNRMGKVEVLAVGHRWQWINSTTALITVVLLAAFILAACGKSEEASELAATKSQPEPGSQITSSEAAAVSSLDPALKSAVVSVDFDVEQGALLHTERLNTWDNGDPAPALRARDAAFLNEQGLHSDIVRIGFKVDKLCRVATNACDFSSIADWVDDISSATDSLMVHLTPEHIIEQLQPPADAEPLLTLTIKELKKRFPKIDYIEVTNEPDWEFHGSQIYAGKKPILQPDQVYAYYVPFYLAVNAVNAELPASERLKVGGPALTGMTQTWMTAFLDGYAADDNPNKRLDFISYHGYGEFSDDFKEYRAYKADPSKLRTQRARLNQWLRERQLTEGIPVYVTETGIYPGPSFDDPDPSKNDYIRQAAGLASLHYWWASQADIYPFNWVVRHASQGRKDQLITQTPQGPLVDTFSPYGNMLLMKSRMKDTRVKAGSDSLNNGQGVYALASKDKSGAAIMVWNYQHTNQGRFRARIELAGLSSTLTQGAVRQTRYKIDQTTSNYWASPEHANLQQIAEQVVTLGNTHTEVVDLEPNALYLMLWEPVN